MYDKIVVLVPYSEVKLKNKYLLSNKPWEDEYPHEYFPEVQPVKYKRAELCLRIQFSAPKILYGNNLLEVNQSRLEDSVIKLHKKLCSMGIEMSFKTLWKRSAIWDLEICKNVNTDVLPTWVNLDYLRKLPAPRPRMCLVDDWYGKKQAKIDQVRFSGKSQEVTFYDKIKELRDKPQWDMATFQYNKIIANILRFEVRLNRFALQAIFGKKSISLYDLANEPELYSKIIKKYWKPFVKASQYFPIYVSPQAQLAQIEDKLDEQTYTTLLLFKYMEYDEGFCYAKDFFERKFGKKETTKILACYKKYPIPNIVDYKYNIMDKLDQAISNPHWWHTMADVFMPNEHPFEYADCLVENFWTTKDSADYLGVCERVIQNLCKKGELRAEKIGEKYRLKKSDVIEYGYRQRLTKKGSKLL